MTWFKVDDTLHAHKKAMRAGVEAMGLWVLAGSWSADQLTDGWVPEYAAERLSPNAAQLADRLVRAGLWVEGTHDGDKGWWFHQWTERQPERADVMADRAYQARKSALYRDQDLVDAVRSRDDNRCRYCGALVNWKDRRSRCGGTFDYVEHLGLNTLENVVVACRGCNARKGNRPLSESGMSLLRAGSIGSNQGGSGSLAGSSSASASSYLDTEQNETGSDLGQNGFFPAPDPTRPDPTRGSPDGEPSVSRPRRKPALTLPDTWRPKERHTRYAADHGLDTAFQAEQFRNHAEANDRRQADWDAAFRQWLGIAAQRAQRERQRPPLRLASGGHVPFRNPTDPDAYDQPLLTQRETR